jgi:hypothetical protein
LASGTHQQIHDTSTPISSMDATTFITCFTETPHLGPVDRCITKSTVPVSYSDFLGSSTMPMLHSSIYTRLLERLSTQTRYCLAPYHPTNRGILNAHYSFNTVALDAFLWEGCRIRSGDHVDNIGMWLIVIE